MEDSLGLRDEQEGMEQAENIMEILIEKSEYNVEFQARKSTLAPPKCFKHQSPSV